MEQHVLFFSQIDKSSLPYVGGKGANLGEMTQAGFPVPPGFCVTTHAYQTFLQNSSEMSQYFAQLEHINADDLDAIRRIGQQIRDNLEAVPLPDEVASAILAAWQQTGEQKAYAVRSSATAEDLPTASFAGQQDTYLNIRGSEQLLVSVRRCFASLFTDRAILYRAKNGFDHRQVLLSVVVQEMVFPEVSGILFTADPISGNRKVTAIDASFGLGEALVSGLVTADLYQVREGRILQKKISTKKLAIYSLPEGGTVTKDLSPEQQAAQALPDAKILELAALGQQVEKHYGTEQDIEWCWAEGRFYVVQSRPITSLYPVPAVADDQLHVFASVGHIQMMTDVMKPIAISVFQNIIRAVTKKNMAYDAGGRIYVDLLPLLSIPPLRKRIPRGLKQMDELLANAIWEVLQRGDVQIPANRVPFWKIMQFAFPILKTLFQNLFLNDPASGAATVAHLTEQSVRACKQNVRNAPDKKRIQGIRTDLQSFIPKVIHTVIPHTMAGVFALGMIKSRLEKWLGDTEKIHLLNRSLPFNVTSEMGLMIGDLADLTRENPQLLEYLQTATNEGFYEGLRKVPGAEAFAQEFERFMRLYGMRCPGEIDISRPRWREMPTALVPSLISHIRTVGPGEHREKFEQGKREAEQAERELVEQIRATQGPFKAKRMARLLQVYRNRGGLRENHKYLLIQHFDIYRQALLQMGRELAANGVLSDESDVFYFTLDELEALEQGKQGQNEHETIKNVQALLAERKKQYEWNQKRTPPRVMTSDGEVIIGKHTDVQVPEGAWIGTPASAGVIEGIARVVLRPEEGKLNPGEILIAPFTDPGWTPLFHSAQGLVTEIGGMMTHGSVVAREYGIPAVVGVDQATEKIQDGDLIRVDGTQGYVRILKKLDGAGDID